MSTGRILPEPYVVENSGRWLGSGGKWSTFYVHVGTPVQHFHVLPSFAGQTLYVPIAGDCDRLNISDCGGSRGVEVFKSLPSPGFQVNASTSWSEISKYRLELGRNFGTNANGLYGFDILGLGTIQSKDPFKLIRTAVAAYAGPDIWVGQIGLSPFAMNFSDTTQAHSLLSSMKEQSQIPSLSFGYQAGAAYRFTKVPGSLVLGGYDRSRFGNKTLTLSSRQDLIVGIPMITSKTTDGKETPLLNDGILATINPDTDEIWLPRKTCDEFARTFNLTYFEPADRYVVNEAVHAELLRTKPSFIFRLGPTMLGSEVISIELPYEAFDLQAGYPIFGRSTNYFPLRRAQNQTQYALGRTFLQEVYLSVDYERDTFNLSQATFTAQALPADIVTIQPKTSSAPGSTSSRLSTGPIIGIAIAAVSVIGAAIGWWLYRRRKQMKKDTEHAQELPNNEKKHTRAAEVENCEKQEVNPFEMDAIVEAPGVLSMHAELDSPHGASEIDEKKSPGQVVEVYELPTPDINNFIKRG